MAEYSRVLSETVKKARKEMKLTQKNVAELIDADERTIMNIEKGTANPTMDVLYPLIRELNIDPRQIFRPEMPRESPAHYRLWALIQDCTEAEASILLTVLQPVLEAMRNPNGTSVENYTKKEPASPV